MADNNIVGAELTMSLDAAKILVIQGLAGKAPRVNATNNHWEVYDNDTQAWVDTGVKATGADGHSPRIDVTETPSGVILTIYNGQSGDEPVEACFIRDGEDGHSPYIGENGHWFVWDENLAVFVDTGVAASGGGGGGSVPSNVTAILRAIHGVLLKAMYTQNVSASLAEILEMINTGGGGDDPTPSETVWQSGSNLYVASGVTASQNGSVLTIS